MQRSLTKLIGAVVVAVSALASAQPCEPGWSDDYPTGALSGEARTLAVLDLGDGPALYAGGAITSASGIPARGVARWDGKVWAPLNAGIEQQDNPQPTVFALAVFNDGTGAALYAGGRFGIEGDIPTANVARWDGERWQPLDLGTDDTVRALAVFDDGTGPALYAGGLFETAGGISAEGIARWDGSDWEPLGPGLSGGEEPFDGVFSLAVADLGNGRSLYAGGTFTGSGQTQLGSIARWDGAEWVGLGEGVSEGKALSGDTYVLTLAASDAFGGPKLYAGGSFTKAGGQPVFNVAQWDGSAWSVLTGSEPLAPKWVPSLALHETPAGPVLSIASNFGDYGYIWWSDGGSVSLHAVTSDILRAQHSADGPDGRLLYAAGRLYKVEQTRVQGLAIWDGMTWSGLPSAGADETIQDLRAIATPDGPRLLATGFFNRIAGIDALGIAGWDGAQWHAYGDGVDWPRSPVVFNDGAGPALYVWGFLAGYSGLLRWNGQQWEMVRETDEGGGALVVFDDGTGPALYGGGSFTSELKGVAKWVDGSWQPIGGGLGDDGGITMLAVFDDGTGPSLYAAGTFVNYSDPSLDGLARWNGQSWESVGGGLTGIVDLYGPPDVQAMEALIDTHGPALYISGRFVAAGDVPALGIARWDGQSWSALGEGLGQPTWDSPAGCYANAIVAIDSDRIVVGGAFAEAGGEPAQGLAEWNGQKWVALEPVHPNPMSGYAVEGLAVFEGPNGPALFAGGGFRAIGDTSSERMARFDLCPPPCPADCDLSNSLDLLDFLCFSARFDGQDPAADCDGSGGLDLFDFLCFVNAFNGGCP